jgi:tRNA/rRNA methyltransferase
MGLSCCGRLLTFLVGLLVLSHCRVVLVRPQFAGNMGAVARVMRNLGLSDLVLVAPQADPSERQARQLSTKGEAILDEARTVGNLEDALADCVLVAGTSARCGGLFRKQTVGPPEDILTRLLEVMPGARTALVFGPEASGLSNDEVARCHFLIHLEAEASYPTLNLAQAVAICLYELRRLWIASSHKTPQLEAAPFSIQERMFAHLRTALEDIHFLYGEKADALMHALRHLLSRSGLSAMEVKLLHGLARQIQWYVDHFGERNQRSHGNSGK